MAISATTAQATPLQIAIGEPSGPKLWKLETTTRSQAPLPLEQRTQLGSVWKLFVYAYLLDQQRPSADYVCTGRNRQEESYCCNPGESIGREQALVQSCGLYFSPTRLGLHASEWQHYWRARHAPQWLWQLKNLQERQLVPVVSLLQALQAVPVQTREQTAATLISTLTEGRARQALAGLGSQLRVKTWTMPDPQRPGARIGGGAGWLASGEPVWLSGPGGSAQVLGALAPYARGLMAARPVPDLQQCVQVNYFARYPIQQVERLPSKEPAPSGWLDGAYLVRFANGNQLRIEARRDLYLQRQPGAAPWLRGQLGLNEYVARVLDREAAAQPEQAALALAVAARSYVLQEGDKSGGCISIDDSTRHQRVSPRPASRAARAIADRTDRLVLTGVTVQHHQNQAGENRLAWSDAVARAERGQSFEQILFASFPSAGLAALGGPHGAECQPLASARRQLETAMARWHRQLLREPGYERLSHTPQVCRLRQGNPYADSQRQRIYLRELSTENDRVTLAHEYLHLVFANHPHGPNESYIEHLARRLTGAQTP